MRVNEIVSVNEIVRFSLIERLHTDSARPYSFQFYTVYTDTIILFRHQGNKNNIENTKFLPNFF